MADDPAPPFWLVWNRHGRKPVYEHGNYHSARTEAERLSRLNPGEAFYVLAPVARGGFDRSNIVWSHFQPTYNSLIDDFAEEHSPYAAGVE